MSFLETPRFPDDIAYGSRGGPSYKTTLFPLSSGHEKRNVTWSMPRHVYDVAYGVRSQEKLYALIEFFHAVAGMGIGFRFKDFGDFRSGSPMETPDPATDDGRMVAHNGSNVSFRLVKRYVKGSLSRDRRIYKPVQETIVVTNDGSELVEDTDYTLDYTTGLITFATSKVAANLKWAGEFDTPVRFEQDELPVAYDEFEHGSISVKLIELRLAEGIAPDAPGEGPA